MTTTEYKKLVAARDAHVEVFESQRLTLNQANEDLKLARVALKEFDQKHGTLIDPDAKPLR